MHDPLNKNALINTTLIRATLIFADFGKGSPWQRLYFTFRAIYFLMFFKRNLILLCGRELVWVYERNI